MMTAQATLFPPTNSPTPEVTTLSSTTLLQGALLLYTDGRGLYAYPDHFAFAHPELNTVYGSSSDFDSFVTHLTDFAPQLSPTGDALLIPGTGEKGKTWLLDLKQGTLRPVVDKPTSAVWDPQGTRTAYTADTNLYIRDVSQPDAAPVAVFQAERKLGWLSWSPDGAWIAGAERTGEGGPAAYDYNFWLVSPEGSESLLLGMFPLPATELSAESVLQWSPDGRLIWINGNHYLTPEGATVSEAELSHIDWVFCTPRSWLRPQTCVRQAAIDGPDGYERLGLGWVLCQQTFWGWSHDCKQRTTFEGNMLYVNDLASGQNRQVAEMDGWIKVRWSPDDSYLVFSTQPVEKAGRLRADIYTLSLETGEISSLPVEGVLVDVIPLP
jgi:hypothetical protein